MVIVPILTSEAILLKTKISNDKMFPQVGIKPRTFDSKFKVLPTPNESKCKSEKDQWTIRKDQRKIQTSKKIFTFAFTFARCAWALTLLSELTWHMLFRVSLNFCSCTTWFLDLDDLIRINRAGLCKESKVSVVQAICQSSSERKVLDLESEVPGVILSLGNILLLEFFLFSCNKAFGANIGITTACNEFVGR